MYAFQIKIYFVLQSIKWWILHFFFFLREIQPMACAPDNNFLSSDQDNNQFLVDFTLKFIV